VILIQIALIILKALGYITWSWWIVFLPLIGLGGFALALVIASIVVMIKNKEKPIK
jgi:hypothetical protein